MSQQESSEKNYHEKHDEYLMFGGVSDHSFRQISVYDLISRNTHNWQQKVRERAKFLRRDYIEQHDLDESHFAAIQHLAEVNAGKRFYDLTGQYNREQFTEKDEALHEGEYVSTGANYYDLTMSMNGFFEGREHIKEELEMAGLIAETRSVYNRKYFRVTNWAYELLVTPPKTDLRESFRHRHATSLTLTLGYASDEYGYGSAYPVLDSGKFDSVIEDSEDGNGERTVIEVESDSNNQMTLIEQYKALSETEGKSVWVFHNRKDMRKLINRLIRENLCEVQMPLVPRSTSVERVNRWLDEEDFEGLDEVWTIDSVESEIEAMDTEWMGSNLENRKSKQDVARNQQRIEDF